jgi:hypothetical protein
MFRCNIEDVGRVIFNAGVPQNAAREGYVPQQKGYTFRRRGSITEQRRVRLDKLNAIVAFPEANIEDLEDDLRVPQMDQVHAADHVARILEQFASDIMQKLGNSRGHMHPFASFSSLSGDECIRLYLAEINTLNLNGFFNQIQ